MKCRQAQDLIYLYRPGELTEARRLELGDHLASCIACAAEWKAALELEERVSDLRNIEPRLDDAALLTSAILGNVAASNRQPTGSLLALPAWTVSPAFRIAACVALFVVCGSFFLQTAIDANRVVRLEGQLKLLGASQSATGPLGIQRAGFLLPNTERIGTLADSLGIVITDFRKWHHESALSATLRTLLGRPGQTGMTTMDYLAKKHPRLASIRIDDGIDNREREILASEGEAFLKDVESLIRKGGVLHDH